MDVEERVNEIIDEARTHTSPFVPLRLPVLSRKYQTFDKAIFATGIFIQADSNREYIGFFPNSTSAQCQIYPNGDTANGFFEVNPVSGALEFRVSSHGPIAQDSFLVDSNSGGNCLIVIITKEGE